MNLQLKKFIATAFSQRNYGWKNKGLWPKVLAACG
jgi:hypothetical protein